MKIAFLAPAPSAALGVLLQRAGCEVSLIARGAHLEAMRAKGLRLRMGGKEYKALPIAPTIPAFLAPRTT